MENTGLTREELQQLGLSEEEIEAVLGTQDNGGGAGLPFPLVKVNYDLDLGKLGTMVYNPQKNEDGIYESAEKVYEGNYRLRLLASYYQYVKFDANQGKAVITSNIFKLADAKKAFDLKTGKLIKDLKKNDDQIKWQRIALVEIAEEDGSDKHLAVFYIKGAFNYDLGDIIKKELKGGLENYIVLTLNNKKQKKGSVTYYTPELVKSDLLSKKDILNDIKEVAGELKQFNDWVKNVNASAEVDTINTTTNPTVTNAGDDDDEIDWY